MAEPSCQYPVIGDRCRCPECVGFHQTTAASLRDERSPDEITAQQRRRGRAA